MGHCHRTERTPAQEGPALTVSAHRQLIDRGAVIVALLVALASLVPTGTSRAAEPDVSAGARELAEAHGGSPADYELLHETAGDAATGAAWSGKYLDRRTGDIRLVHRDAEAGVVTMGAAEPQKAAGSDGRLTALEAKGDAELRAAVEAAGRGDGPRVRTESVATSGDTVPVGVWLLVDVLAAEQAVIDRHPGVAWDGGRPLPADLETARAIRAELADAHAEARAAVLAQFAEDVTALGGNVAYESTNAPLVYVDVPADAVEALAALPAVSSLGLERTWAPAMSAAAPTVQSNWTGDGGDQGTGVRVAVVEYHNVRNSGDLAGRVVASYSTTGRLAYTSGEFDHPTWVAGAIASRSGTYPGVAPGALIVSASTGGGAASLARDRDIIKAADWAARTGDADIINASIGQDTATGSEEARRYFDALVHEQGRLAVAAAGNYVTFGHWNILSPGTAYNVLTVGGIDDRGTTDRNDDRQWYYPGSNGSNYRDVSTASWNTHGDFNKPNLSAPAPAVRTANGLSASGTSIASPIVAGIAAQVLARAPSLALRPEVTRAILMAGAINRTRMPDGSLNADHEGTGSASALWANRILNAGDGRWGGHRLGTMTEGQTVTQEIAVVAGQKVKVVVAWNSHTAGSGSTRTDRLMSDLDLRITQPNGAVIGSYTFDNNYEWVEFTAARTGTVRIDVRQSRFDATSERYGLAWTKWNTGTPIRIAGADRYGTAAAISAASFAANAPVAYVATGANFPDALAGGPAAGVQGGPVLLTQPTSLPTATRNELTRLRPGRIVVLGGPSAVSPGVMTELDQYTTGTVTRVGGADRYGTAAAVSEATFSVGVPAAFVATGAAYPDALSAGPAAIAVGGPVLLTQRNALPEVTRAEIERLQPRTIYILGGTSAVSDSVRAELDALTPGSVIRVAGADRYGTSAAVAKQFFASAPSAYLATGGNFPDALASVAPAGRSRSPLLLVSQRSVPAPIAAELVRLWPPRCFLIGGTQVVGDEIARYLVARLGRP